MCVCGGGGGGGGEISGMAEMCIAIVINWSLFSV